MADVVILKQPLYGTVEWDGVQFIYTPNPEITANDSYTYKVTNSEGTKVLTNYINPFNRPPIPKNVTLNVNAASITEINVLDLIEDNTNYFNTLTIQSITTNLTRGYVSNTPDKIIFESDRFNSVETISYTIISDKQFVVSGTITINVINGIPLNTYTGSPYARFGVALAKMAHIKPLTGDWSSMAQFLVTYGPIWDSIDADRYNAMAAEVSGNATDPHYVWWNTAYANLSTYISLYNSVTANSADWELTVTKGDVIYNTLTSEILNYYSTFNTLTANSNNWTNNISATSSLSAFSLKIGEETTSSYNTLTSTSAEWDTSALNAFSAQNFKFWDSLYKTLSTDKKYPYWNNNVIQYDYLSSAIYEIHDDIDSTYNTVTSTSAKWDTSVLNAFSAQNFPNWENTYNTLTAKYDIWNITLLSSFTANYFDYANKFNNVYTNVASNSSDAWDSTILNSYSAKNYNLWDSVLSTISGYSGSWLDTEATLSALSTTYFNTISTYDSLNDTVTSHYLTAWDRTIIQQVSSYLPKWDDVFHILINTDDNTTAWDRNYTLIQQFSGSYLENTANYTSTSSTVVSGSLYWSDVSTSSALTGNSGKWDRLYNLLTGASSNYSFDDRESTINLYTTITGYSGDWDKVKNTINAKNNYWLASTSISSISSQALTGNATTTVSSKDLAVYGNTLIIGNLSALGKRITIDTSVATTSSFIVDNRGNTNAMVINKTGGFDNAILNLNLVTPALTSIVLYVKTSNSVGVNLSSFDTTNALTVSGNISASGIIYPISNVVTTFSGNSSRYTSTYTGLTGLTGDYNSFRLLSTNYNDSSKYVNLSSNIIKELTARNPDLSAVFIIQKTLSGYNNIINNHVTLCASEYGKDTVFRNNKYSLDTFYNNVTSITGGSKSFDINVLFSYNTNVSAASAKYIVENDIKINSWTMVASKNTVATVDVLSSDYNTYGNGVVVSKANRPHLDNTDPVKITSTGVSTWLRNITKNSILEFNMRNLTPDVNTAYVNYERINSFNAGNQFSNIITPNGSMYGWGRNASGQLGVNSFTDKSTPTLLSTAPITAAYIFNSSVFVKGINDELSAFGGNSSYELGLGTITDTKLATKVNLPYVKNIKSKNGVTMVLGLNNKLTGWGGAANSQRTLGLNDFGTQSNPIELTYPSSINMLITNSNTFAIGIDGGLSGAGTNTDGQLGQGTTSESKIPVKINLPSVSAIYGASDSQTTIFALGINGELSGWGGNANGNLGIGNTTDQKSPVRINVPKTKQFEYDTRAAFAVGVDGSLSAWGFNYNTDGGISNVPVLIPLPPISVLYVKNNLRFAVGFDGGLSGWGSNDKRQLVNNTALQYFSPVKISVPPISALSIGNEHILALGTNGELSSWGGNFYGQVGTGTTSISSAPIQINSVPSIIYPITLTNNTEILLSLNVSKL